MSAHEGGEAGTSHWPVRTVHNSICIYTTMASALNDIFQKILDRDGIELGRVLECYMSLKAMSHIGGQKQSEFRGADDNEKLPPHDSIHDLP